MKRIARWLLSVVVMAGCEPDAVTWSQPVYSNVPPEPREPPERASSLPRPSDRACPGSIRLATNGSAVFATWWETRADSSVTLLVARSATRGAGWRPPVVADSTDRGARGCGRHPPAIAADSSSGYLHVAYFLESASGAGVFFQHSMDEGRTFHSPVPIVFGRNSARVSVAASGNRVAVAYEDPNSVEPLVGVALSRTLGHIFEHRVEASSRNERAKQPVVRVDGDSVRLWWSNYSANPAVSATRAVYRSGAWR